MDTKAILGAMVLLLVIACQTTDTLVIAPGSGTYEDISYEPKDVSTKQFSSEEELNNFLKKHQGGDGFDGGIRMAVGDMAMMEMAEESVATKVQAAPDFSETNVQVVGIDEADILKTDGNYIYTVTDKTLFIIKAYPGEEAEVVSKINFKSRPDGIFLSDDKLAVFGSFHDVDYFNKVGIRPREGMTFLDIYDISNKEVPEKIKDYKFEGNYFNGRMMGDHIYVVTRTYPNYRGPVPIPLIMEGEVATTMPVTDISYFDIPYNNPQFVNVHALDMKSDKLTDSKTVVVEGGQNMYMSHENIFITYTQWINEYEIRKSIQKKLLTPHLTAEDKNLIAKIKAADDDVLSHHEKENKIYQVYMDVMHFMPNEEREVLEDQVEDLLEKKMKNFKHLEFTIINKLGVKEGKITVLENGKVPGAVNNQFSMDEKDGILRIATTLNQRWMRGKQWNPSTNNVYALDKNLDILGKLEGLAEEERIFSTRFMGDKLYMVTFRQVDPFFVIDLSNPRHIRSLGELKIPGFSRYLHPYDETTIIGIGQDATDQGRTRGLKISLFDVSNVAKPKEIAKYIASGRNSQSTAMWEHKAFLFSREKNLLVIPAYNYGYDEEGYNGAFVFEVKKNDIDLRGLIDHSQGGDRYYGAMVERSLYIEELLYTKSPNLLRINELEDLSSVKDIDLEKGKDVDFPVY